VEQIILTYQKGDIISVSFPFTNSLGSKKRPTLTISSKQDERFFVVLITSKYKNDGLSISINDSDYKHLYYLLKAIYEYTK
jgi:hypothetical protein